MNLATRKAEEAIGGGYQMPDGREFWIDRAVVMEILARIEKAGFRIEVAHTDPEAP